MLDCQKHLFQMPEEAVYLNCSYMSPGLRSVEEAGINAIIQKRTPYEITTADFFSMNEAVRKAYAQLIGSDEPGRVVLIPAVSYGISTAARNIPVQAGDEILLIGEQFPSNVYPWLRLAAENGAKVVFVDPPDQLEGRAKVWNERILSAINAKTKVVALAQVHWTDGTLFDLKAIRDRSDETGAYLVVDGTQSVGAMPFNINEIKPDALVVAAYKWLMGPYSMGLAYYGPRFDQGSPLEENWMSRLHSEDFSGLVNYQEQYHPFANRYEVGQRSNFILLPMVLEGLKQINRWKPESIQAYCSRLSYPFANRVRDLGCWVEDEGFRGGHLMGIRLPGSMPLTKVKERMNERNIFVSFRGTSIRVSPNVYNRAEDMEKLLDCFRF